MKSAPNLRVQMPMRACNLPNYLKAETSDHQWDVGLLTDEDAAAYWKWMEVKWLAHVKKRRENLGA